MKYKFLLVSVHVQPRQLRAVYSYGGGGLKFYQIFGKTKKHFQIKTNKRVYSMCLRDISWISNWLSSKSSKTIKIEAKAYRHNVSEPHHLAIETEDYEVKEQHYSCMVALHSLLKSFKCKSSMCIHLANL